MLLRSTVQFPGDLGAHIDKNNSACPTRTFTAIMVRVGGVFTNTVRCTGCARELLAYETGLARPDTSVPYSELTL